MKEYVDDKTKTFAEVALCVVFESQEQYPLYEAFLRNLRKEF
jgi:hypothetical protein